jgi:hypothetical protein
MLYYPVINLEMNVNEVHHCHGSGTRDGDGHATDTSASRSSTVSDS